MAHNDRAWLHKLRTHWQREQHLIRKKYQISYQIVPSWQRGITAPDVMTLPATCPRVRQQNIGQRSKTTPDDDAASETQSCDLPIYCSTCHRDLKECTCPNGIGQWWRKPAQISRMEDERSGNSSRNSTRQRRTLLSSSVTKSSSMASSNTDRSKALERYVLLDWNNRQSLLEFLRTATSHRNLSDLTVTQLQELISDSRHLHLFDSIIDLMLHKASSHLYQIYIDRSYHSTLPGMIPFTHSSVIADNLHLSQSIHATQILASRLTNNIDSSIDTFLSEQALTSKRTSIREQQSRFLASRLPKGAFYSASELMWMWRKDLKKEKSCAFIALVFISGYLSFWLHRYLLSLIVQKELTE